MNILSVGCGGNHIYRSQTLRDINLDLALPTMKTENFIRAEAHHLPFRPQTFSQIYASHLIEHLQDPHLFIHECLRTSSHICLITPNPLEWSAYLDPTHRWVFIGNQIMRITPSLRMLAHISIRFKHFRASGGQAYPESKIETRLHITGTWYSLVLDQIKYGSWKIRIARKLLLPFKAIYPRFRTQIFVLAVKE